MAIINMIRMYEDESVHSFIYRSIKIMGMSCYGHVIGYNGLWRKHPTTPDKLAELFRMLPDALLLQILQREGYYNNVTTLRLESPEVIVFLLDYIFGGSVRAGNSRGVYPVVFCKKCCAEMLKSSGHIWFKSFWRGSTHCPLHGCHLKDISGRSLAQTIENIDFIFHDSGIIDIDVSEKTSFGVFSDNRTIYADTKNIRFIFPCALYAISCFIKQYYSDLMLRLGSDESDNIPLFFLGYHSSYRQISPVRFTTNREKIMRAFYDIQRNDYQSWRFFMDNGLRYEVRYMGFNQKNSIAFMSVISVEDNCSTCELKNKGKKCFIDNLV